MRIDLPAPLPAPPPSPPPSCFPSFPTSKPPAPRTYLDPKPLPQGHSQPFAKTTPGKSYPLVSARRCHAALANQTLPWLGQQPVLLFGDNTGKKHIDHHHGNPHFSGSGASMVYTLFRTYGVYPFPLFSQGNGVHHSRFPKEIVLPSAKQTPRARPAGEDKRARPHQRRMNPPRNPLRVNPSKLWPESGLLIPIPPPQRGLWGHLWTTEWPRAMQMAGHLGTCCQTFTYGQVRSPGTAWNVAGLCIDLLSEPAPPDKEGPDKSDFFHVFSKLVLARPLGAESNRERLQRLNHQFQPASEESGKLWRQMTWPGWYGPWAE